MSATTHRGAPAPHRPPLDPWDLALRDRGATSSPKPRWQSRPVLLDQFAERFMAIVVVAAVIGALATGSALWLLMIAAAGLVLFV
ncbi:MAG TPA: hypothetical protein PKH97_13740 [Tetrasphaera sp.]|uniref:hypothetical protein n=1 Tax=Nostocoides sp. TaxID=1917966 RepID=UPI002C6E27C9|nr:hypothetical protein [Tetrasphaera sp.]HNQ08234.1 hypothetical protein [Tetrasphaera sp.]